MTQLLVPRHQQKIMTDDTVAVRKVRELRKYTRTHAGVLLGISGKQVEAIENGRVQLTDARIDEFCAAYKISRIQYESIKTGKLNALGEAPKVQPLRIIEHKSLRRNYKKIIDRRVRAIISLRYLSGLTQQEASFKCGYARCQFGQLENGRIELSEKRIRHVVSRLGFTLEDFKRECAGEQTTHEMRSECAVIINGLCRDRLLGIFPLLKSLQATLAVKAS